jgi:hypothetical protein
MKSEHPSVGVQSNGKMACKNNLEHVLRLFINVDRYF